MRNRTCGGQGERLKGLSKNMTGDPSKQTPILIRGISSGFASKRDKFFCGTCTCFKIVGMCPSMPDMFDGCRFLAETKMRGVQ